MLFLSNKEINKSDWDECIINSSEGQPYALSWYLDSVCPDWKALVIQNENGNYTSVMPIPHNRKYGFSFLKQPFFCQQLGIFSIVSLKREIIELFIKRVRKLYSYSVDYTLNYNNTGLFKSESFEKTSTRYLNLNLSYNEIFQGYNRDRKTNLKRAIKSGLQVLENDQIEALIEIFKKNTSFKINGGVSESTYDILRLLFSNLKLNKCYKLYFCKNEHGEFLNGALYIVWRNRIIYLFSASTIEGRKKNGISLIMDHVIKKYSNQNFILDFESPETPESFGIDSFNKSFGGISVPIMVLSYNEMPFLINSLKALKKHFYHFGKS
jgi:hypothetical protein